MPLTHLTMNEQNQSKPKYHDNLEEALEHFDDMEKYKATIGEAIDNLGLEEVMNMIAEHIGGMAVMRLE